MGALVLSVAAGRAELHSLMNGDAAYMTLFLVAAAGMFFRVVHLLLTEPIRDPSYGRQQV